MNLKNKKILVTGSDGFIGSHLVETLIESGYDIRAFVYYNSFGKWGWLDNMPKESLSKIEIVAGDIRDPFFVRRAVEGCQVVLHLAALIAIPYSYNSPQSYIDTNITGTLNILQASIEKGVERVIHTSTSEVYGTAQFVPITEKHPLQAQSPYAATKIGADQIALSFHKSFSLPVTIVRPFNTYGPRQSARAVIPTIISQIASGKKTIKIGAIRPTRDFTFVKDTALGFIHAAESDSAIGHVINLGSGFEISIGDTIKTISEIMDTPIELQLDEERLRPTDSEVERLWSDNSLAQKYLHWSPNHKGLEGFHLGLKKTIQWFSDKENLRHYRTDIYNV